MHSTAVYRRGSWQNGTVQRHSRQLVQAWDRARAGAGGRQDRYPDFSHTFRGSARGFLWGKTGLPWGVAASDYPRPAKDTYQFFAG